MKSIITVGLFAILGILFLTILTDIADQSSVTTLSTSETILTDNTYSLAEEYHSTQSATTASNVSLKFDGIDDTVIYSGDIISNASGQSFEVWFKSDANAIDSSDSQPFLSTGYFYAHLRDEPAQTNSTIKFRYSDGIAARTLSFALPDNDREWHHMVAIFEPNNDLRGRHTMSLYVDGKNSVNGENIAASSFSYLNTDNLPTIINENGWNVGEKGGVYFNGSVGSVKIYDRAITGKEALELYYSSSRTSASPYEKYIPIIMLHQYVGDAATTSSLQINESMLIDFMEFLQEHNYETITYVDYLNWTKGNIEIADNSLIIGWDDSSTEQWYEAAQIMDGYGYHSVMQLNPGSISDTGTRNWTTVNDLIQNYSWGIASHNYEHCHVGSRTTGTAPTWCNTTDTRRGNMSLAKTTIQTKTGVTPVAFIPPYNDFGIDQAEQTIVMADCDDFYEICTGNTFEMIGPCFNGKHTNLTNGEVCRVEFGNFTSPKALRLGLNQSVALNSNLYAGVNLREGSDSVAHDYSDNSYNGTISGAVWQNDSSTESLTKGIDYTASGQTFTIINPNYAYSTIDFDYKYWQQNSTRTYTLIMIGLFALLIIIGLMVFITKALNLKGGD